MIYASTFSKILSPGVRLGWAAAPAPILQKMQIGKQGSDLCSSSISQYFVSAYFDAGPWEDYVGSLLEIYRRRRDVMLDALAEHFPREAQWTHPEGGLFIWATMPASSTPPTCSRGRCASTWRSFPGAPRLSTAAAARCA